MTLLILVLVNLTSMGKAHYLINDYLSIIRPLQSLSYDILNCLLSPALFLLTGDQTTSFTTSAFALPQNPVCCLLVLFLHADPAKSHSWPHHRMIQSQKILTKAVRKQIHACCHAMARHGTSCLCCLQNGLKTKCVYLLRCTNPQLRAFSAFPQELAGVTWRSFVLLLFLLRKLGAFPWDSCRTYWPCPHGHILRNVFCSLLLNINTRMKSFHKKVETFSSVF